MNKRVFLLVKSAGLLLLALGTSFFSVSVVWGSHSMFLSGINMVLPTLGALLGITVSLPLVIGYFIIKGSVGFGLITAGLPTLCSAALWSSLYEKNRVMRVLLQLLLPATCMALFALHSVGSQALLYTLYWLIPMALFFVRHTSYSVALSSTFVAHAVGSVIWLYTIPMTAEQWIGLIPVVAVERLLFATGALLFYSVISSLMKTYKSKQKNCKALVVTREA